jgi:hypothetical protein
VSYSDFDEHKIELEILAYFLKNPDAQDTLEGIVGWWLLETYIRKQYAIVKKALSYLVDQGLIIEVHNTNSEIHYQVNKEKIRDIQERLKDRQQSSS